MTEVSAVVTRLAERAHDTRPRRSLSRSHRQLTARDEPDRRALPTEQPDAAGINWKFEDQAFKTLLPKEYRAIARLVNRKRAKREAYTRKSAAALQEALECAGINGTVQGRTKNLYSIYRKLQRYHACARRFCEIYDLTALRVIVGSVTDCYLALGVVHENWRPVSGEFDDYIASPKENFYQSLHTSVIGPENQHIEVQIRTKEMNRIAEEGAAAHFAYKQTQSDRRRTRPDRRLAESCSGFQESFWQRRIDGPRKRDSM